MRGQAGLTLTATGGGQAGMICATMPGMSALGGMPLMYLLMAITDPGPWLDWVGPGLRRACRTTCMKMGGRAHQKPSRMEP